jgi:uncharacterized protein (DUF1778 family)
MPKSKSGAKRMVTTNIKVTEETHAAVQVAAELAKKTQSALILDALLAYMPEIPEEIKRRKELQEKLEKRRVKTQPN